MKILLPDIDKAKTVANANTVLSQYRMMKLRSGKTTLELKGSGPIALDKQPVKSNGYEAAVVNEIDKQLEAEKFCKACLAAIDKVTDEINQKILNYYYIVDKPMTAVAIGISTQYGQSRLHERKQIGLLEFAAIFGMENIEVYKGAGD
ncbi:ArpU family phage packaging/lysis transcriptional regulator [Furfurilactobacillus entadae]|uniref:ArpU family phage packaging/lysis transcriptional regulator n=1 Tax=Furfurilactobacillus entadae TaxID=2922307 RepID=UPI0035EBA2AD